MTRRCSHCSNNGHNSRTCPGRAGGVRLFGVQLAEGMGAMKKSASMGCLPSSSSSSCSALSTVVGAASPSPAVAAAASPSGDQLGDYNHAAAAASPSGYVSDDPARASCSSNCRSERKKGVPWTEEEHRMFLMGLQKLGKGNWRGIARNFVVSRTPTQVARHAQKYFIRQSNASRRKRRSSLFDMVPEMLITDAVPAHEEQFLLHSPPNELESSMPVPIPFWPSNLTTAADEKKMEEAHKIIVKPTPVIPKEPVNVDEVVGMAKLSIGEPPALSLKLLGSSSSWQSAFQINPSIAVPDLNQSNSSPIHAV